MANFNCDLALSRARVNLATHGFHQTFEATVVIPAGVSIAQNDTITLFDLAAKHPIVGIRVYTDDLDDGTTMVWDVGYTKLSPGTGYGGTDASGVATDFDVATGTTYTSPASDTNHFVSAATFGRAAGWSTLTLSSETTVEPAGLSGPVRVVATQTAATPTQSTAALVARTIRFEVDVARDPPTYSNSVDRGGY